MTENQSLSAFGIDPLTLDAGENERLGDLMEDNDRLAVEVRMSRYAKLKHRRQAR